MNSYSSLARFYDCLTTDVPYTAIADFYESVFAKNNLRVKTILDMACGTGTLTCMLSGRGYEMIAVDASADMLSVADHKSTGLKNKPMFLNQPMECLDLYGTVDAVVCSLDGINYVRPEKLRDVFHRVRLFLEPGGVFIFDIHTPSMLKSLDGEVFLDETESVYCVWRASFDEKENACVYGMDIFAREGRKWARSREEHIEYAHEAHALAGLLMREGFSDVRLYGDMTLNAPQEKDRRVFITAS